MKYEERFKTEAVKLALSSDQSYVETARDLGLKLSTLKTWIYKHMEYKQPGYTPEEPHHKPTKADYQSLERELKAARKELELRKKEIEILKKAAAYFANMK